MKWERGSCLSDSSPALGCCVPQAPICWCREGGRSHLVAAAPTLESRDPKRGWDSARHPPSMCSPLARGGEEATYPGRETSSASENKNLCKPELFLNYKSKETPVRANLLKRGQGGEWSNYQKDLLQLWQ